MSKNSIYLRIQKSGARIQNNFYAPKSYFFCHSDYWILNSKFPVCSSRKNFQLHNNFRQLLSSLNNIPIRLYALKNALFKIQAGSMPGFQ